MYAPIFDYTNFWSNELDIITSVHENSYYGRLTNPSSGGIIINLIKQRNAAIISLYDSRFSPFLLIPYIETAVDDIRRASGQ